MPSIPFPMTPFPVPSISTEQMIEVDRLMVGYYGIDLVRMMENAGRGLAILARERFLKHYYGAAPVVILAGTGGNGGGVLVAARRLINWGIPAVVYVTAPKNMKPVPGQQLNILHKMGIPCHTIDHLWNQENASLILDGIIGYSLSGHPRGAAKAMIQWANQQKAPILSLDTPSGIDLTNGTIYNPVIQAKATLTLALPKHGLFAKEAIPYRGELYLADIGVPNVLYQTKSIDIDLPPIFKDRDIVRIG